MIARRLYLIVCYALVFLRELIKSNIEISLQVLKPTMTFRPAILAVPHHCQSALELTMLANSISLTPGTLVVDLSLEHKILYVHALSAENPEAVIAAIQNRLAKPIREIFS